MQIFMMLVGVAGSGKSTYTRLHTDYSSAYKVHSSDALRAELYGDENIQGDNNELFNELHRRIISDLRNNRNVIYDACNLSCKRRIAFLEQIRNICCYKKCVIMATPYEQCLINNSNRERRIPDEAIHRMYLNFNFPAYFEGWDKIDIHYNNQALNYDLKDLKELNDYDQQNPNHTLTLGGHMTKCYNYLINQNASLELCTAGGLHDIGKPFCQTFFNTRGEPSDRAHYYNHQNVGAYLAMFYLANAEFNKDSIINICTYIQYHMQPYFNVTEKSKNKYRKLWGQDLYDDILLIHTSDEYAH